MRASFLFILILIEVANIVLGVSVCHRNNTDFAVRGQSSEESLVRRRRSSLVFPKGSAFVTTVAMLKAIMVKEPPNWNLIYEFDVIWPIPSEENFRKNFYRKPWLIKRRHRREIYNNFEMALNSQNLPGRQCVLRTICEAATILNQPGLSLVEKALKVILGNSEDVEDTDYYDLAYRKGTGCNLEYPCPFSFLQLLLYCLYSGIVI
ncbi:PREDICTED: uncharacterized protein LOC106787233 [Polistes canadensis]|uniref:uncharacterized protein LOC106787233 n=1 Tax=Polistes canadensis TaxID=91411 RepID=UPI000718F18B|nr:PREDICTED: uncharacterized protein LOC106787233 [Polistes canadensis]